MKRTVILILILALLLAACGPAADPVPTYTAAGTPTAKGVLVYTDPSAYRPYQGAAKYTRLREGPLESFEPSDDYGAVYPYAAARLYTSGEEGQSTEVSARWGLVDASGRILTDGIYASVEPLSYYDYDQMRTIYYPYWVVANVEPDETAGAGSRTGSKRVTRYALISMDGSFMLPMEYIGIRAKNEGTFCAAKADDDFEIYDGSGQYLFNGGDLFGEDYTDGFYLGAGEGLYLMLLLNDEQSKYEYWFCDSQGEKVLGPYADADFFQEGLACVSQEGHQYGYIDATGSFVIEPSFEALSHFREGRAIQRTAKDDVVIDTTGNIIFSAHRQVWYLSRIACGYRGSADERSYFVYDFSGNVLFSSQYYPLCPDEDTFCEKDDDGLRRIFRLDGSELVPSVKLLSLQRFVTVLDGKPVEGYLGYSDEEDNRAPYFIPLDLSALYQMNLQGSPTPNTDSTVFSTIDQCTNELWYLSWNGEAWDAVSEAGEIRSIPLRVDSPVFRGDRYMVLTDRTCVYLDWEGKVLFSYPLDAED